MDRSRSRSQALRAKRPDRTGLSNTSRVFIVVDAFFVDTRRFSTCRLVEAIERVVDVFRHVHRW